LQSFFIARFFTAPSEMICSDSLSGGVHFFHRNNKKQASHSHAQTYYDRIKKSREGVCAAHSRNGVLTKKSANNKCVGNVIHLLEQISQYHRA
jgi:hypothetical protein